MSTCSDSRTVTQDTPATVVPSGESIVIPAGSVITITHRLGGHFTVTWEYGMARIAGTYAPHIGEAIPDALKRVPTTPSSAPASPPTEAALWEALRGVFDPEIPVNIVDLGLVYSLELEPLASPPPNTFKAWMKMTLTAPGCGMGPAIAADAKDRLLAIPGVADAQVDIVWDPPWTQDMISEAGKMELGLL